MNPRLSKEKIYLIGLDIGTSSTKAVAFNMKGEVCHRTSVDYPIQNPKPGWFEQSPQQISQAVIQTCSSLIKHMEHPPQCIVLSSMMHSIMALGREGEALSPLLIWADQRSAEEAALLQAEALKLLDETGTPVHPMSPLCKCIWWQNNTPDLLRNAWKLCSIKAYVLWLLCGELVEDFGVASASGLFDLRHEKWSANALTHAGISESMLPSLVKSTHQLSLKAELAKAWGIPVQCPVIAGGSDGCLANLGALVLNAQDGVITVGTSAAIRTTTTEIPPVGSTQLFTYYLDDQLYVSGGASNNGGAVYAWLEKWCTPEAIEAAIQIDAGAEGLYFLPYLFGERAPLGKADAKAAFVGLGAHHTASHFAKATLEGLAFNIALISQLLENRTGEISQWWINGGLTRSKLWQQAMASILDRPLLPQQTIEASARGAAFIGMKALGMIGDYEELMDLKVAGAPIMPLEAKAYEVLFQNFKKIVGRHYA